MKRSKITLVIYSDPGHSWCRVHQTLLEELNIQDKITRYSYKRNGSAYLEEDVDFETLVRALDATYPNIKITYKEHHTNKQSKIRSYVPYTQLNIFKDFLNNHVEFIMVGEK
ncbi:hypothetical protein M0R04_04780 [Candidatus Dojkabacteria bacterium]|jgi:hypothetical protein|nr:hypothetical protein [Candidatus Dojkabacteria bacterium]